MRFDINSPVQTLDADDCRALLQNESLGRIAFATETYPMVLPVNYVCFEDMVVFRTDVGLKLENVPMRSVAFEIDGLRNGVAWSVVVLGHAREVTTALGPRFDALRATDVPIQAPGVKGHWIAIEVEEITGRTFSARPADGG